MIKEYKEWLFVEIIGQYSDFFVTRVQDGLYLCCPIPYGRVHWICSLPVERGAKVSIVGLAKDLTEEQWSGIFKESGWNKICDEDGGGYVTESDFKSMATAFMQFKGFTSDQNILILKKL